MPFAPAGGTDILTHLVAAKLEQQFNKPFVVENRPGGATVIATNFVAKSPPDGYTIMMSVSSLAIDATLYKTLPYDPGKDLALVALGKRAAGLRVVRVGGQPVGFWSSLLRNIARLIDMQLLFFYIVGSGLILSTNRNQRLGDLLANTLVVRDRIGAATTPTLTPHAAKNAIPATTCGVRFQK